ncbi:MAG: hypothetical protein K0S32_900 [Bacteroidetes bacterium]|jgi:hypothetical protein|nr:hypothetical protein [Bacteroidota bacterium]
MLRFLYKTRTRRIISFYLLIALLTEIIYPTSALALTGGPSTPEVQSFEPVSTSEMVDLFTGDFKYNIPLMDVGGYPINIAYNSGISTDQEASWIGLGWNLNVGNISRGMRGIPDDFNGTDVVLKEFNMKPNQTYGINAGVDFELFGFGKKVGDKQKKNKASLRVGVGVNYNNYKGYGVELSVAPGISAGVGGKGRLDAGLGLHSSATGGLDISPNLSYSKSTSDNIENSNDVLCRSGSGSIGGTFNTRAGLKQLSFSASYQRYVEKYSSMSTGLAFLPELLVRGGTKGAGLGSGGSINFGLQTYVPHINMPMENNSVSLSFKLGTHIKGSDINFSLGGYYSNQKLATHSLQLPAYGYMYAQNGQDDNSALMDFNREKDGSFSRFTKNLPVSNFTYDVYNATGQGSGGTFRPFRHDVGHVFDNEAGTTSDSYSIGGEFSTVDIVKAGLNVSVVDVNNKTKKWTQKNKSLDYFKFKGKDSPLDEPYYFRAVGEKIADNANSSLYADLGGDDAFAIKLNQSGSNSPNIEAEKALTKFDNPTSSTHSLTLSGSNYHTARQKRNQNFSTLTYAYAKNFGLQKDYYNSSSGVTDCAGSNPAKAYIAASNANSHHIAEVTVLNTDGSRYIYGLPAYNTYQKEVNFNVSGQTLESNGLVRYDAVDASVNNARGIDNNFGSTTLPAYAHSYLLTAVVSTDYMDLTGNGPTDDDLGTYTKFHYKKSTNGSATTYKWRMPSVSSVANNPLANYNEGSKSNTQDQTASYTYGEKELWYLNEIETKNYIAVFETSNRTDAYGVSSEHGVSSSSGVNSKKLDKITLYSKPEYKDPLITVKVPIKIVNFVYETSGSSNELCPGTYNSGTGTTGKLTLKSVYFTYGKSDRAKFNSYDFTYTQGTNNFSYHPKAYDRWGNYKPEQSGANYSYANSTLSNGEFPYTEQNPTLQNAYAQAWHLKTIDLPTGGRINISYESDDYAYVQNFPAGQMFAVVGSSTGSAPSVSVTPSIGSTANLFSNGGSSYTNYDYLIINGVDPTMSAPEFRKHYLKDLHETSKKMHFKFLVNLTKSTATPADFYEYVSGYADIDRDNSGVIAGTGQAYIKLKNVNIKRQNVGDLINPIALAALQFGRLNYGDAMWGASFSPPGDAEEALKQLGNAALGSLTTMVTGFKNPNKALADKDYCSKFITGKSLVRLYNGTGKKLGGGSRVSQLELIDNWQSMTTTSGGYQASSTYGQKYMYTKTDEFGRTISSGVASYEPMVGGEENSMKQPLWFGSNKWTLLAPDDRYFTEGPYGESFFPSPGVGYSNVKVESIVPTNAPTDQRNGYKVSEFYTAKDYPTITENTPIIPKQHRPPLGNLLKIFSRDFIYTSQGFVIKTNDMHGKPKAELDYAYNKTQPIKEVRYYYKTENGGYSEPSQIDLYGDAKYSVNKLDNTCKVIYKDGTVGDEEIGVDFDATADFRESETKTTHVGAQLNVSIFLAGIVPAVVPTVWPTFNREISRFRSAVLTKVINQYGILQRTEVRENGSVVNSENLAYDSETGNILVTKTKNTYSDEVYSLKYPAHWGYDMMGQAYKNLGVELSIGTGGWSGNVATITGASAYLKVGDEVGLLNSTTATRAWVCSVGANTVSFIDVNGALTNGSTATQVKVIRSAYQNKITDEMATLTSLENPLPSSGPISISGSAAKILNASGVLYSDKWQMPKGVVYNTPGNSCSCSISSTGTELLNVLQNLMNKPNNSSVQGSSYSSAFFNGVSGGVIPAVLNSNITQSVYPSQGTVLWVNGSPGSIYVNTALTPSINGNFDPNFEAGYCVSGTCIGAPTYSNYGITNLLVNALPMFWPGNPQYVGWAGPGAGTTASNPFVNTNQIIGFFMMDDPRCNVTFDFYTYTQSPSNTLGLVTALQNLGASTTTNTSAKTATLLASGTQTDCSGSSIMATLKIGPTTNSSIVDFTMPVKITCSCLNNLLSGCTSGGNASSFQCGKLPGETVNPFVMGLKGNWRPKTSYAYLTSRKQTISGAGNTDTRKDGYFNSFSALYSPNSGNNWTFNANNWTNTVETSKYNQNGVEIETKDALGRYSSAVYGYNESLPVAVASNAQLREIAYDGFEDYGYYPTACNKDPHFNFAHSIFLGQATLNSATSHTGKFSLRVSNNGVSSVSKKVHAVQQSTGANNTYCGYVLADHDFIYPFSPVSLSNSLVTGIDYVVSYWVKQDIATSGYQPVSYVNSGLTVTDAANFPFTIKNQKRSSVIDGWQKEEYTFVIPVGYQGNINITLNNTCGQNAYFDDIRIHPYSSNMKSFVYHPVSLKYVAELDANNYATFYEYDDQGNLVRVKKETEKGIMTIQESKTHSKNIQ